MLIYEKEKISEFVILISLYKLLKYLQIRENIFSFLSLSQPPRVWLLKIICQSVSSTWL